MIKYIAFVMAAVLLVTYTDNTLMAQCIFLALYAFILITNSDINIKTLAVTLLIFKGLEISVLDLFSLMDESLTNFGINNRIFFMQALLDAALAFTIVFRASIYRNIYDKYHWDSSKIHLIKADIGLVAVYLLFMIADLSALGENMLRNLDKIGFSNEVARPFWEWNFIYYNYELFKHSLMGLEFLVIWSCVLDIMKEKFRP